MDLEISMPTQSKAPTNWLGQRGEFFGNWSLAGTTGAALHTTPRYRPTGS